MFEPTTLELFETLEIHTQALLDAAEREAWDSLVEAEALRAAAFTALQMRDLSDARLQPNIQRILELNARLLPRVTIERDRLGLELRSLHRHEKAELAYRPFDD